MDFIKSLAHFLVHDAANRGIRLQLGDPWAKEWAALRNLTPVRGYPTVTEATKTLDWFLSNKMDEDHNYCLRRESELTAKLDQAQKALFKVNKALYESRQEVKKLKKRK
jgi:hypothetical protein